MNVRDKLIKILSTPIFPHEPTNLTEAIEIGVDYLLNNGVTVQEWIPVSELPQESGEYAVILQEWEKPTTLWYSKQLNGWYEFEDDDYLFDYKNVTHWMPLPQPPPKGD